MGEWVFGWEEFGEMMEHKELIREGIDTKLIPKYLYKYREFSDRTYEIILNSEFYFASPLSFNDPFDCNLSYKKEYSKEEIENYKKEYMIKNPKINRITLDDNFSNEEKFYNKRMEVKEELIKNSGILSLSKTEKSIPMWSHYSKKHQGLVFELDVKEDYNFFRTFGLVDYVGDYEILSLAKFYEGNTDIFATKYIEWKDEEEIRIIDYEKSGNRKFKKKLLKTIYFGCKAKEIDIKHIIQLCQLNGFSHVVFKKAKRIHGKFKLDFDEINKNDYLES